MDNNISFSKIVATPTLNSWSQAYNAGKLFAVLSLEKTQEVIDNLESLNLLGKALLERLEQEFFTIENKNLETIKKAISTTFEKKTEGINISFSAGAFIENVLYLFALGKGKVFIKRENNLGLVLDSAEDSSNIGSSSGFLKDNDLIVLATDAFSQTINSGELNLSLNDGSPAEIAESLAPKIHKAENGKISAIIIKYSNPKIADPPATQAELDEASRAGETEEEIVPGESFSQFTKYLTLLKSKLRKPNIKIQPTRKLFLTIAIIIVGILIFSVFMTIQNQNNAKMHALFKDVYAQASKKYDEGKSLLDLNKNLALDSLNMAFKLLDENKSKFSKNSKEEKQILDLLAKVNKDLDANSPEKIAANLDRSKITVSIENGSGLEGVAGKAADFLKSKGYNVAATANADNYKYVGVTIKVKTSTSAFLNILKKDLSEKYTINTASSDLPNDSTADAVIIIGK